MGQRVAMVWVYPASWNADAMWMVPSGSRADPVAVVHAERCWL